MRLRVKLHAWFYTFLLLLLLSTDSVSVIINSASVLQLLVLVPVPGHALTSSTPSPINIPASFSQKYDNDFISQLNYTPNHSILQIHKLTLQYKPSLLRKLFSSIPMREYAVHDITCTIGFESSRFVLLIGASSSGKSAFMKCLTRVQDVNSGAVFVLDGASVMCTGSIEMSGTFSYRDCNDNNSINSSMNSSSIQCIEPVLIDRKFRGYNDDSKSVKEWIILDCHSSSLSLSMTKIECVLQDLASVLELSEAELNGKPSTLSPSAQFIATLMCGSLKSITIQQQSQM